jgi:hypothetical protein
MPRTPGRSGAFLGAAGGGGKVQPVVAPFFRAVENEEASGAEVARSRSRQRDSPESRGARIRCEGAARGGAVLQGG